ncbi:SSU ribosomal protein S5P [Magnetococcus marinus MC-1]|uniref:Small ribosomal subunit protein uS5 n=1 Tax=Magnetococcus marinus (strain ATCC BAA-1437 / JCM 17883 / MC-1) TaxID=156889 RepID=RS5_MAGMM|nr:30S ribosomal protein S5 [Magnetococcus marinus]A0L5Z0.1 RecName: Full=Small ribosomal subunit protein uS5; AltName: Full=30S ribosomal protein S5 [Magnetococcus marinus MC-1]ABK43383.1 SSU ribosomal protein S5P [Magnetococcus marinus MC-1]
MSQREKKNQEAVYESESEFIEKLVAIKRTAKVVKGGSRFNFSAIVVVGDGKGSVGYGLGKAKEVPEAIRKATDQAQKQMIKVEIKDGRTIFHETIGRFGAGNVVLRPASAGTGIIAGGSMRPIFEAIGISDVLAKSTGTSNPHNLIKATFAALQNISPPKRVAAKRGLAAKNVRIRD